jgi:hypothetical protein
MGLSQFPKIIDVLDNDTLGYEIKSRLQIDRQLRQVIEQQAKNRLLSAENPKKTVGWECRSA